MRSTFHRRVLFCVVLGIFGATSGRAAAPPTSRGGDDAPSRLTPVDQVVGDQGVLDVSLRKIDPGLALPSGYRFVYERSRGGMMRANGGLAAVFPKSIYVRTRDGLVPDVPAGTRFVIGGLPMGEESGHGQLLAVDPMRPDAVPAASARAAGDGTGSRSGSDVGFGPGYRVALTAEPAFESGMARFQLDEGYRSLRLRRFSAMLSSSSPRP